MKNHCKSMSSKQALNIPALRKGSFVGGGGNSNALDKGCAARKMSSLLRTDTRSHGRRRAGVKISEANEAHPGARAASRRPGWTPERQVTECRSPWLPQAHF